MGWVRAGRWKPLRSVPLLPRPDSALFSAASFCSQKFFRCSLGSHYRAILWLVKVVFLTCCKEKCCCLPLVRSCSLTSAVGSFGSWELLLTPVLWVRNLLNVESFSYAQVTEEKMYWSLKSAISCIVQSGWRTVASGERRGKLFLLSWVLKNEKLWRVFRISWICDASITCVKSHTYPCSCFRRLSCMSWKSRCWKMFGKIMVSVGL